MANPYKALFKAPGALAFSIAGLIARMPVSMAGIGIITMLAQLKSSYWIAGAVAATFTFSMAILAPQISRMVDRFGQSKVLPYVTMLSVISMFILLLCSHYQAPDWTLFVFAALSGGMPSMPAMVRARWSEIYRDDPRLHTAFSFESVLDELCFIIGPPISVGLSVAVAPEAGPLAAAILLVIGVMMFILQKQTEPPVYPHATANKVTVLSIPSVQILVVSFIALGTIVGTIDVISVAFAERQGQPAAASIVLSAYAVGSCLAGLIFGAIKVNIPLPRLFMFASLATMLATVPLFLAFDILTLSTMIFISGLFFAPTMIIAMGLVENTVPSHNLTEGLTWVITGLGVGVAFGASLSGWVVDEMGIQTGFIITLIAGVMVFLTSVCGYKWMLPNRVQQPV
ncbi:MFS transporter [Xenorhabdus mauleonii]|uniref:MFS transporter n=1 Tax=Xenorhabdus mauleonii TaxID=351675 RepID=A0A1I3IAD8_9GAMM|nr:MFS transporter [Xenorhabdus mauleonii]PHM39419.1 MFS transporter [Xenorhabdus mauleonii]SFI44975.1 Predicted arabinose efflux permease, MFS family [Xenorhabdus mauleonii]